jgi:hypothetical protein
LWALIIRNPRSITIGALFLVLACVGGVGAHILEQYPPNEKRIDWITVVLFAMMLPIAISSAFVAVVSFKWLTKQWETENRDTVYAEPLKTPAQMAQKRHDVVISCKELTSDVYCTSHCNLFHDPGVQKGPDGATGDYEDIINQNRKFFRALAKLTIESRPGLKLLLYVPNNEAFQGDLGERIDVYLEAAGSKDAVLDQNIFDPKQLMQESLTDYLVFEDNVFMTLRKSSKGRTEYVYIRSEAVADHYRAWLKDLFETGERGKEPRVEEKEFRAKFEELVSDATGERERAAAADGQSS